ncbi:MAG: diguanylate cyclase [Lachnospiraceae bacterium]|nr:diguanylate cyclase [Lachnospiraceae bacterium]
MGLIYTTDNCVGCNKCVRVCSAPGASVSRHWQNRTWIHVDDDRCIGCGVCFDVCEHQARAYEDDTDQFFADLRNGKEKISLLLAPSFLANYPEDYGRILGGLKDLGINQIISVSFGADICTWGYLNYMKSHDFYGGISTPCPVAVTYIQRYLPELIPMLMPVQTPLMCTAIYCRKVLGITDKFAFISPCIQKRDEIRDPANEGLVSYNVTFQNLMKYVREDNIYGENASDKVIYGLGSVYPMPGGLKENVQWFLGNVPIRVIDGKRRLYRWFKANKDRIRDRETPFALIDALNCEDGCMCGTAVETEKGKTDDALYELLNIRNNVMNSQTNEAWGKELTPEERFAHINEQFKDLKLEDYVREYSDLSHMVKYRIPSEEKLNEIFHSMHKHTPESRKINCSYCGYDSCMDMATAICNGFNEKENCIYFRNWKEVYLERMSFRDELTGVMNRNAYEQIVGVNEDFKGLLGVVIGDVNGLKLVNDTLGHQAGDNLIHNAASSMAAIFGENNVYRIGGDEFLAIIRGFDKEENEKNLNRIRQLMAEKDGSISLGYASSCNRNIAISDLVKEADAMMYREKQEYHRIHGKR